MFEVCGDEITFRRIPFATIDGKAWPTLRAEAEDHLLHGSEEWIHEDEHLKELTTTEEKFYRQGEKDAQTVTADRLKQVIRLINEMETTPDLGRIRRQLEREVWALEKQED